MAEQLPMLVNRPKEEEPLCCCEFIDYHGERRHVLASCCDCEVLDDICERIITGTAVPSENLKTVWMVFGDRLRVPCCGGSGAMKLNTDVVVPIFMVPGMICLGACGPLWTAFAFFLIPAFCLFFYMRHLRHSPRTRFFVVWSLSSLIFLFGVMEVEVIPYMEIYVYEILIQKSFISAMLFCVYYVKGDPGVLDAKSAEAAMSPEDPEDVKRCTYCNTLQINRTGHCRQCNTCIIQRDHHCIWVDSCIGGKNHRAFFFCLIFLVLATYYGAMLTLTTVCEPLLIADFLLIPHDCTGVYDSIHLSVCFVSALYALMIMVAALCALLHQVYLISINMTAHEWRTSRRNGYNKLVTVPSRSKGFFRNWRMFCCGRR